MNRSHGKAIDTGLVHDFAGRCGFDLAGVASAGPHVDFPRYRSWAERGLAGEMRYLADHRAGIRGEPADLLPGVRSVICVGLVYNGPEPLSKDFSEVDRAWISRYAWGEDYHEILRSRLKELAARLAEVEEFGWRACVDTAPLLERSYARAAGLGWIGRNTCLINQMMGSWFFLGELLTTLDLEPDHPPPDRCGTCSRCIDDCPTEAIVPSPDGGWELDARLCISYFTIELREAIPESHRASMGANVFGCDICQDVCPWNRRAPETHEDGFRAQQFAPSLESMAAISEPEFRALFRATPVSRARYRGFLRNVAVAMGNAGLEKFREPLSRLANSQDPLVAEHARWSLARLSK